MFDVSSLDDFNPLAWKDHHFSSLSESTLTTADVQEVIRLGDAAKRPSVVILDKPLRVQNIELNMTHQNQLVQFSLAGERQFYRLYLWLDRLAIEAYRPEGTKKLKEVITPQSKEELILALKTLLNDCCIN